MSTKCVLGISFKLVGCYSVITDALVAGPGGADIKV